MKKLILSLAVLALTTNLLCAQDYDFRKVSKEEVQMSVYEPDTLASAVYLNRYRRSYYDYESNKGWLLITEVVERIKILTKDGLDYGTEKRRLYKKGGDVERISDVKGYTYTIENDKLVETKLKKSGIFKTEISDNIDQFSIVMPGVKVGAVIEYKYKITSPFWYSMDDVIIQTDIPVAHFLTKIQVPDYFRYNRQAKGGFGVNPKDYTQERNMHISYEQRTTSALTEATKRGTLRVSEFVTEYEYTDVPALVEEPYVDNIDNYRYMVTYELATVDFPDRPIEYLSNTWEEVVKTINESRGFGDQIAKSKYYKEDLDLILSNAKGELEKFSQIFDFVKNRMTWNENLRLFAYDGLSGPYKNKSGSSAEINLILLSMLQKAGLKARPVLISTRDNGIPVFPTLEGFNNVIVSVDIADKRYLLDATEKLSSPNMLPTRDLNWYGTLINDNGSISQISMYPTNLSKRSTLLNVQLDDEGGVFGTVKSNYTELEALGFRMSNHKVANDKMVERVMNTYSLTSVDALELTNMGDLNQPAKLSFEFEMEEAVEEIGNDLYLSPLLFLKMETNPFTLEERNYPIDYKYPYSHRDIVTIMIPEGYQVASLPEPISLSLPEGMGSFKFNVNQAEGRISVMTSFTMNNSVVPAFKYPLLKEFYNQRVAKENEKVVLTKI